MAGKGDDTQLRTLSHSQNGEEEKHEPGASDGTSVTNVELLRQPTPEIIDDPTKFESAKQKKTTLLQGLKKFNFKPKKVSEEPSYSIQMLILASRVSIFLSNTILFLVERQQT
jgi:brefeldin A-inhibited guanine nucleotide-exchange protein